MRRREPLLLQGILDAIAAVNRHRPASLAVLETNELIRVFVQKQIEIIGEAAARLSSETREASSEIPWHLVIGMRNRLVHDYANVDCSVLWNVMKQHLEPLGIEITKLVERWR